MKYLYVILATLLLSELTLRLLGFQPLHLPDKRPFEAIGAEQYFVPDPILGYRHSPGLFKIQMANGLSFTTTQDSQGFRLTHPTLQKTMPLSPEVWIFGCSFAYGWMMNDAETFPWLLQRRFKNISFRNFGVSGYGTLQSLLQLKEALKQGKQKPKTIVLAYADFHQERNVFSRRREREVLTWKGAGTFIQPYAWIDREGQLKTAMTKRESWKLPLSQSFALVNALDLAYVNLQERWLNKQKVTYELLLEFAELARANGIRFVLANVQANSQVVYFAKAHQIEYVDIFTPADDKYTNLPYDSHPNALANQVFAQKLGDYLAR